MSSMRVDKWSIHRWYGAKHSIGLSFADAKTLAKFVTEGRP